MELGNNITHGLRCSPHGFFEWKDLAFHIDHDPANGEGKTWTWYCPEGCELKTDPYNPPPLVYPLAR